MRLSSTVILLAGAFFSQVAEATAAHPTNLRDLTKVNTRALVTRRHRTRDGHYRNASLRARCVRKSTKQVAPGTDAGMTDTPVQPRISLVSDEQAATNITSSNLVSQAINVDDSKWLKKNCVTWGWVTDDGDRQFGAKGRKETPAEINAAVGKPAKYFGTYAHIDGERYRKGDEKTYFDGREVMNYIEYLKGTGSTAILSVMPVHGWGGLTSDDNTQALQIVKMLKLYLDADIEVIIRFGHEMNWYTRPNSDDAKSGRSYYAGGGKEFIEGWKTMAAAVRSAYPQVKLYWCANIARDIKEYAEFWPGADTVDIVGIDYYPREGRFDDFASHVQEFHDTYAKAHGLPSHLGETGAYDSEQAKREWLHTVTSEETCNKLPNLEVVSYFNYHKEGDYRLAQPDALGFTKSFVSFMQ